MMMTRINFETENCTMEPKAPSLVEKIKMASESVNSIFAEVTIICECLFEDDPECLPKDEAKCLNEEIDLLNKKLEMLSGAIYSIKSRLMM